MEITLLQWFLTEVFLLTFSCLSIVLRSLFFSLTSNINCFLFCFHFSYTSTSFFSNATMHFSYTSTSNRGKFLVTGFYILLCQLSMPRCCRSCHVLNRKGCQSLLKKSTHELSFWWPVRSVFIITKRNQKPISETNQTLVVTIWLLVWYGNFVMPWIVVQFVV